MNNPLRHANEAAAHTIHEAWGSLSWLASQAIGNAEGLTLGRVTITPGRSNPRHRHNNGEEVLYLISGQLEHWIGDRSVRLQAGDTLSIPAGVAHWATNTGDVDADMIVAYSTGNRDFVPEP